MSRSLYLMRVRWKRLAAILGAHGGRDAGIGVCSARYLSYRQLFLTVPLLCSLGGSGFEVERPYQVQSCMTQVQVMQRRPQVDHVPLLLAARVEALEHVLVEVHAKGAA